ncbi:MAG: hypothetical protein ABSF53_25695 [Terracidiphilus sp.]
MFSRKLRARICVMFWWWLGTSLLALAPAEENSRFTVKDDIELTQLAETVISPHGNWVLIHTWRASLKDGMLHDQIRLYASRALRTFVDAPHADGDARPVWSIDESTAHEGENGPLITNLRWLDNEAGFAFLLRTDQFHRRLSLAQIGPRRVQWLSPSQEDVLGFAVRDRLHYAFTVASRKAKEREIRELSEPLQVGTGRLFFEVMSPEQMVNYIGRGDLWAANGGRPVPVNDPRTGGPVTLYEDGSRNLSLSPDGKTLITIRAVESIPRQWETNFPPPFAGDAYRISSGVQDLDASSGPTYAGEFVRISLANGNMARITNAPEAVRAGWWEADTPPAWSDDGSSALLPGTFRRNPSENNGRPCILFVQFATAESECVRSLKRNLASGFEPGYETVDGVAFARGRTDRVILTHLNHVDASGTKITVYARTGSGSWRTIETDPESSISNSLAIKVNESFKDPPTLVAIDTATGKSRVFFDLNPQLKRIAFGEPELYSWQDDTGRNWQGILYKPVGFESGVRYPLVIQNHGFSVDRFVPSGAFPSAFIAQELASAGIMVLQVRDCAGRSTPEEGPCNVIGYESAVAKLSALGLVDSSRVGIIGFSRTVFYALEALTTSSLRFKAASITEGVTLSYESYLLNVGPQPTINEESVAMIGSRPVGRGWAAWFKASPEFNMDKVMAPLRVVATRGGSLLGMWGPYAALEDMRKPVDLIVLNTDEHVITNPVIRLAAQQGNLDWFRFWLQEYEDPDPGKASQYVRWRKLKISDVPQ